MITPDQTREIILEGAGEMFLRYGYEATGVRKISAHTGVNLSAINYHFGSKQNLYYHILEKWFVERVEEYPLDKGVPSDCPADERLHCYIANWLKRMAVSQEQSEDYTFARARLLLSELVSSKPKPDFVERCMSRDYALLTGTIRELSTDTNSDEAAVKRQAKAIMGICLIHLLSCINPDIGDLVGCDMDIEEITNSVIELCTKTR